MINKFEYYATSEEIKKIRKEVKALVNSEKIKISVKSMSKGIEPKLLTLEHEFKYLYNPTEKDLQEKSTSSHVFVGYCQDLRKRLFNQ